MTATFKITDEMLAASGLKSPDEFCEAVAALLGRRNALADKAEVGLVKSEADAAIKEVKTVADENATALADLATKIPSDESIKALANTAGSAAAIKALSGTGSASAQPASPANEEAKPFDALVAAGKFEEAYAASKAVQAEFPDAACYASFMKNRGLVKISARKQ